MAKHTQACAWWAGAVFSRERAVLHENLAEERGGERKHISAAVSRSRMIIGPPQEGQDQVEVEGCGVEQPSSSPGGGPGAAGKSVGRPRNWKQRGKRAARRRWARKPKWRIRTKPGGSTWSRKRRKNSSTARVITRCWLPCAESLQRKVTWLPSRETKR